MINKILLLHDKEEENEIKEALMRRSGIPMEYITFRNIYYKDNTNDFIHLMIIDDINTKNKKDMVFLHGLSSSSIFYYGILRELSKNFRIFALDIPGMGCSSRNEVDINSFNEAENYFLDRIKCVFDSNNLFNKITLVGHSLGGYLLGLFAIKYPERIENLVLMSPVGISSLYYKYYFENFFATFVMKRLYDIKYPPTSSLKLLSIYAELFLTINLDIIFKDSWMKRDEEGWRLFKELVGIIFRNYCFSEKALFYMFDSDLRAYKTLTQNYEYLEKINILFFYGENDWNPKEFALDLKELIPTVEIEIVKDSTHLLYGENLYDSISKNIIEFVNKNE